MKFKIGDRVEVKENGALGSGARRGDKGVIYKVNKYDYSVLMENKDTWFLNDKCLVKLKYDKKELKDRLGYLLDKLEFMVGNDLASNNEIDADIQELKCLLTELEVL